MSGSSKSFATIHDDYAFFETHANEAEADLAVYQATVAASEIAQRPRPRVLDFGSGPGTFGERFLTGCGFSRGNVQLSVVEPDEGYRRAAVQRLEPWSVEPIVHASSLPMACW